MFLKIMGALPGYIYAQDEAGIYVNLFVGSRAELRLPAGKVVLRQTTRYPWQGEVRSRSSRRGRPNSTSRSAFPPGARRPPRPTNFTRSSAGRLAARRV